jgi:hypothetical protein
MYPELLKALQESGYSSVVAQLQNTDPALVNAIKANARIPMSFLETSSDVISAIRSAEAFQFAKIGEAAMSSIRDNVMRTVLAGVPINDTLADIRSQLEDRFQRYAWTYANTTRKEVIQAVHFEAAKAYDGELYWEYVGPEDNVTRDVCLELLAQRVFTDAEMQEAEASSASEREYNCRHVFVQITKDDYESAK